MNKKELDRFRLIFIVVFFAFNVLNCFLLTTNFVFKDLSPYPRNIFMVTNSILGDIGFLLVLFSFSIILIKTDYNRFKYLMIVSIFLSVLYIGMTVYFGYYKMIFSFYNLKAFDSPAAGDAFGFLISSLTTLLVNVKPFFILSAVILIVLFFACIRKYRKVTEFKNMSLVSGINRVSIGFSTLIVGVLLMASSLTAYQVEIEGTWHKDNQTPLYGVQTIGLFNYYVYDAYNYFFAGKEIYSEEQKAMIKEKLEEFKKSLRTSPVSGNSYDNVLANYGAYQGKNLLMIQMESINNFVIGLEIEVDGQFVEVTPNLNRLLAKSIYFNQFYHNVGIGNTSDTEFVNLTGIYPQGPTYTVYEYNQVQYETLPKLFIEQGYSAFSIHANNGLFYERSTLHPKLYGFEKHYAEQQLDIRPEQRIHTWLNDYDMLFKTVDLLNEYSQNGPAFGLSITITCHMPYNQPTDQGKNDNWFPGKDNLLPGDIRLVTSNALNNQLIGYLEHVSYTDWAIGEALKYLEESGLADDTIVVLYGDHGSGIKVYEMFYENPQLFKNSINPMIEHSETKLQTLLERQMLSQIPFIIYDHSYDEATSPIKAQTISLVRGMSSTARTLANLFGLNPTYYFGVDALSDAKTFTYNPRNLDIFADGIVISATSREYFITDPAYQDFYNEEMVEKIIEEMLSYKDFNDKLLRYEIFPKINP